jgi:hypothetical protein
LRPRRCPRHHGPRRRAVDGLERPDSRLLHQPPGGIDHGADHLGQRHGRALALTVGLAEAAHERKPGLTKDRGGLLDRVDRLIDEGTIGAAASAMLFKTRRRE